MTLFTQTLRHVLIDHDHPFGNYSKWKGRSNIAFLRNRSVDKQGQPK